MKKRLLIGIIVSAILVGPAPSIPVMAESITEAETESDVLRTIPAFNGYKWGASIDDVVAGEITDDMVEDVDYGLPNSNSKRLIIASTQVAGFKASAFYTFSDEGKLVEGGYLLKEEHANNNKYYDDYKSLVKKVQSLYGDGEDHELWSDDLFKDDPNDIGIAIASEGVAFLHKWTAEDGSNIICSCSGSNYNISIGIRYEAPTEMKIPETENTSGL